MTSYPLKAKMQAGESATGSEKDVLRPLRSTENEVSNDSIQVGGMLFLAYSLVDEIIKLRIWQSWFFLLHIVVFAQVLCVSLWPYSVGLWTGDDGACKFVRGFATVAYFTVDGVFSERVYWVLVVIYLVILAVVVLCFLVYKCISRIPTVLAYIGSFVLQNACYVLYIPCCVTLGASFSLLVTKDALSIFMFVVLVLVTVFASWLLYAAASLINYCSSPSKSLLASFDGIHTRYALLVFGITRAAAGLCSYFGYWFTVVLMLVHSGLLLHLMCQLALFPFVKVTTNVLAGCWYVLSLASNVAVIVKTDRYLVLLIVLACLGGVAGFGWFLWFYFMGRKIKAALNDSRLIYDDSREEVLSAMNINREWKGLLYMRMGFVKHCLVVYNGIFTLDLCRQLQSPEIYYIAISILSYFPMERESFMEGAALMKRYFMSTSWIFERLKALRLIKMEQLRYSTGSTEVSRRMMLLTNQTDEELGVIKRFWAEVADGGRAINLNVLSQLGEMNSSLKAKWKETLVAYPNEFKLANEYSRYLIECEGKFSRGMYWDVKSEYLEQGFSSGMDDLFRVFAITNPEAIHAGIVEKTGKLAENIVCEDNRYSSTSTSGTGTNSNNNKFIEDLENGRVEERMEDMFESAKLRTLLERAAKWGCSKRVQIWLIFKYLVYVVMIILCIVVAISWQGIGTNFERIYNRVRILNMMRMAFGYSRALVTLNWANETDRIVPPREVLDGPLAIGTDFWQDLAMWSETALDSYTGIFQSLAEGSITANENITHFAEMLTSNTVNRLFCFYVSGIAVQRQLSSPKQTMISVIWIQTSFQTFVNLSMDTAFCQYNSMFSEFSPAMTQLSLSFAEEGGTIVSTYRGTVRTLSIVFFAVWICLIVLTIIPEEMLRKEAERMCEALKSVSQNDALQASQLLTKGRSNCVSYAYQPRKKTFDTWRWGCLGISILLSVGILALVIFSLVDSLKLTSDLQNYLLLGHYGTARNGMVAEMLALLAYYIHSYWRDDMMYNWPPFTREDFNKTASALEEFTRIFLSLTRDKSLQDLHIVDECEAPQDGSISGQDFYKCLGLQRAISTYVLYGTSLADNVETEHLNTQNFGYFMDLCVGKLYNSLLSSDALLTEQITNRIQRQRWIVIPSLVICAVLFVFLVLRDVLYTTLLFETNKAGYLLLRHLPPASIVETPAILKEMVPEEPKKEVRTVIQDAVFDEISQPTLCLGEGNIIEMVNNPFTRAFNLTKSQIIGQRLTYFIPETSNSDKSKPKTAETDFYEKLALIWENKLIDDDDIHARVACLIDGGASEIDIVGRLVRSKFSLHVLGIVFFIEDIKRARDAETSLTNAQNYQVTLQNQLIPPAMQNNIPKEVDRVIVIALRIAQFVDFKDSKWGSLEDIITLTEELCRNNPPFQFVTSYFDTVVLIGGLTDSAPREKLADTCEHLVSEIKTQLNEKLERREDNACRFVIAVAEGGPVLATVRNENYPKLVVVGPIINDAIEAAASSNDDMNTIVVSPA